jgi:hypothetical protein
MGYADFGEGRISSGFAVRVVVIPPPEALSLSGGGEQGREESLTPCFYCNYGGERGIRTPGWSLILKVFSSNQVLNVSFVKQFWHFTGCRHSVHRVPPLGHRPPPLFWATDYKSQWQSPWIRRLLHLLFIISIEIELNYSVFWMDLFIKPCLQVPLFFGGTTVSPTPDY